MDELRQTESSRLNANRPPARAVPTAELQPLLRREWQSLNHDQQGRVVALFERAPTLASAYVPRTPLTAIFNIARIAPPPRPAFSAGPSKSKSWG